MAETFRALQPVQLGTSCQASPVLQSPPLYYTLCKMSASGKASCTVALSPALQSLRAGPAPAARPAAQPALHPPGTASWQCLRHPWPAQGPQAAASAHPGRAPWQGAMASACSRGAAATQRQLQRSASLQSCLWGHSLQALKSENHGKIVKITFEQGEQAITPGSYSFGRDAVPQEKYVPHEDCPGCSVLVCMAPLCPSKKRLCAAAEPHCSTCAVLVSRPAVGAGCLAPSLCACGHGVHCSIPTSASRLPSSASDIFLNLILFLQAQGQGLPLQSTSRSCILTASLPIKLDVDSVGLHQGSAASRRSLRTKQVQAEAAAVRVLREEVSSTMQRVMHDSKIS